MKHLNFKTLEDAFENLQVQKKGQYYLCRCPHCGQMEAFFYLTSIENFIIKCNRLTHCGKSTKVSIDDKKESSEKSLIKFEDKYDSKKDIDISAKGLKTLMSFLDASHKDDLPLTYRGISQKTLENYIIFYPKGVKHLFGKPKDKMFGKKYFRKLFDDRDIIIPIRNKEGVPERCLLRSTKQVKSLKEFQLRLIDKGNEIWNVSDIFHPDKEFIFVCEGVFDALSIMDVLGGTLNRDKFGYIALAGVGKHSQITNLLKKNKGLWENHPLAKRKTFIICFDLDKAGLTQAYQFWYRLKSMDIPAIVFNYLSYKAPLNPLTEKIDGYGLDGIIDLNDWYQKDSEGFSKAFRDFTFFI